MSSAFVELLDEHVDHFNFIAWSLIHGGWRLLLAKADTDTKPDDNMVAIERLIKEYNFDIRIQDVLILWDEHSSVVLPSSVLKVGTTGHSFSSLPSVTVNNVFFEHIIICRS